MAVKASVVIPDIKEILTTGLQFGHSTSRWNPKMAPYIFGAKDGVHIIDVVQSRLQFEKITELLQKLASEGEIWFVGTKRQASKLIEEEAVRSGAYFVSKRWAGGLLTNFDVVQKSLAKLRELERLFEEGVEDRTKYEVVKMKNEWRSLTRLYGGIKTVEKLPKALVVVDPKYEKIAVREARIMGIPVIALVDTNCDPTMVDYVIPGNDDALRSIELFLRIIADAVLLGNEGKGVKHSIKDYTGVEVKIVKKVEEEEKEEEVKVKSVQPRKISSSAKRGKGILEVIKDEAEAKKKAQKVKTKSKTKTTE